jgi:hypothetical protein
MQWKMQEKTGIIWENLYENMGLRLLYFDKPEDPCFVFCWAARIYIAPNNKSTAAGGQEAIPK